MYPYLMQRVHHLWRMKQIWTGRRLEGCCLASILNRFTFWLVPFHHGACQTIQTLLKSRTSILLGWWQHTAHLFAQKFTWLHCQPCLPGHLPDQCSQGDTCSTLACQNQARLTPNNECNVHSLSSMNLLRRMFQMQFASICKICRDTDSRSWPLVLLVTGSLVLFARSARCKCRHEFTRKL